MQYPRTLFITGAALLSLSGAALAGGLPGGLPGGAEGDHPGRQHLIQPQDLPAPYDTPSVGNHPQLQARPKGFLPDVPEGFAVNVFAEELGSINCPRTLAVAPNGDVFAVASGDNKILVLRDGDGDGVAEQRFVFANKNHGLFLPFGIAFRGKFLFVANTNNVVRFPYQRGQTRATGKGKKIITGIPGQGYNQHWTRNLAVGPNDKLYLTVGSETNLSEEPKMRAAIHEYKLDGTGHKRYAWGIRNPVGLAFNPVDGALWATCNERDGLGNDLVPDYFTRVQKDQFYGWPWFYIGKNIEPRIRRRPDLAEQVRVPDVLLRSHSAALGCIFYAGTQFPQEYRNDAFIALHGSWNRSLRTGYKVVRVRFQNGQPVGGYEDFMTGLMVNPSALNVYGRPVGLAIAADGSLLVSDDGGHRIWRIRWEGAS